LNIDDATLYRFYNKETAACDEPFGREFRVKRLRVERLSRIEIRIVDLLPAFVATSVEQAYAVFFLN
jgi:hypothetical protein